ncbi:hypothetical protein MVEN_00614600 [Mycena venus]|uniref:Uncharacterized protein n=1 Tax=Mycena venus TaxID=2733690 RepID=A0A8H6YK78_9AGAR|nr:hypothetical protein MVEN_00614600 [Mycena venus]
MCFHYILCILIWVFAVPEVQAVVRNITLAAGSSDNITLFNAPDWGGPGGWPGLTTENVPCNASSNLAGKYSIGRFASVSVIFEGTAVYFVGWNNSLNTKYEPNGVYQAYLDGVPDSSSISAFIPGETTEWCCNIVQYQRTGLVNTKHNLTIALIPDYSRLPSLAVNGFIVTVDDNPVLSVPPATITNVNTLSAAESSTFSGTTAITQSSASQAPSTFQPTNSTTGSPVLLSTTTNVSTVSPTATSTFQPTNSTTGSAVATSVSIVPPPRSSTFPDITTMAQSSVSQETSAFQPTNSTAGSSVLLSTATNVSSVPPVATSTFQPKNYTSSVLSSTITKLNTVSPAKSSTFLDTTAIAQGSALQTTSTFQPTTSTTGGPVLPSATSVSIVPTTRSSTFPDTTALSLSSALQGASALQPTNSTTGSSVLPSTTINVTIVPPAGNQHFSAYKFHYRSGTFPDTTVIAQSSALQATSALQPTNSTTGGSVLSSTTTNVSTVPPAASSAFQPTNSTTGGSVLPSATNVNTLSAAESSTFSGTTAITQSSALQAASAFQPTNSTTTGGSVLPTTTSVSTISPTATSTFQPTNSTPGDSVLPAATSVSIVPPPRSSTFLDITTITQSSALQATSDFQSTNSTTGGSVLPTTTNISTVSPTATSTFQPKNSTSSVPPLSITNLNTVSPAKSNNQPFQPTTSTTGGPVLLSATSVSIVPPSRGSTFLDTATIAQSSALQATSDFQSTNSTTGGSVLPTTTNISTVSPTATSTFQPKNSTSSVPSSAITNLNTVSPAKSSTFLDTTAIAQGSALQTTSTFQPTTSTTGGPVLPSATNVSIVPTARSSTFPDTTAIAQSSASQATSALQPTSSTTNGSVLLSTTTNVNTVPSTATSSIVAGILGLVGIIGVISLAGWASQVIQAKKASKPGANSSKSHDFIFFFPPYLPRPKKEKIKSHQITLTLTPLDIEEGYTYKEVVWQRFNIDDGSSQFTARLDYDRAFGTANIRSGRDDINGVSFCDRPLSIGHAKPGRIIPLKGSAWANPLEFIIRKYTRITARNDNHFPVRMVLGSYICEGSEVSSTESSGDVVEGEVRFQSFVVMDDPIGYAETLSASFDLILRAYKTNGAEVGQILSPQYLRDEAVPLLGERGIRISKLPKITTWGIIPNESGIELKRERTARRKYFQAENFPFGSGR